MTVEEKINHGIIVQVHDATSKLSASPTSPEDFADLLDFMLELEQRRHELDETYDHVCLHCTTLQHMQFCLPLLLNNDATRLLHGPLLVDTENVCIVDVYMLLKTKEIGLSRSACTVIHRRNCYSIDETIIADLLYACKEHCAHKYRMKCP